MNYKGFKYWMKEVPKCVREDKQMSVEEKVFSEETYYYLVVGLQMFTKCIITSIKCSW